MNLDLLQKAANQARGLAMDAVHDCASGHLGLPLGCAEIGAVLFGDLLNICPAQPRWLNRDRFILSAGHGSMFLYGWLHLSGFNIGIEDLKGFRHKGSITPGHPEFRDTEGVECTTGPLGQGIANAVGFALSARRAAARFNKPGMDIFTQHIFCLTGDGCLQEGVARESLALAAVLKLDNLILIYDSNDITLDAPAERTQLADPRAVYEALGWDVRQIDGHDLKAIAEAVEAAKNARNGKPQLIIAKTIIGKGIPGIEGTTKGHGEPSSGKKPTPTGAFLPGNAITSPKTSAAPSRTSRPDGKKLSTPGTPPTNNGAGLIRNWPRNWTPASAPAPGASIPRTRTRPSPPSRRTTATPRVPPEPSPSTPSPRRTPGS